MQPEDGVWALTSLMCAVEVSVGSLRMGPWKATPPPPPSLSSRSHLPPLTSLSAFTSLLASLGHLCPLPVCFSSSSAVFASEVLRD